MTDLELMAEDMVAFGASDRACYLYPGEGQSAERAAYSAGVASMAAHLSQLRAALQAAEDADDARDACEECCGEGQWEHCGPCSERFGTALVLRRLALAGRAS